MGLPSACEAIPHLVKMGISTRSDTRRGDEETRRAERSLRKSDALGREAQPLERLFASLAGALGDKVGGGMDALDEGVLFLELRELA